MVHGSSGVFSCVDLGSTLLRFFAQHDFFCFCHFSLFFSFSLVWSPPGTIVNNNWLIDLQFRKPCLPPWEGASPPSTLQDCVSKSGHLTSSWVLQLNVCLLTFSFLLSWVLLLALSRLTWAKSLSNLQEGVSKTCSLPFEWDFPLISDLFLFSFLLGRVLLQIPNDGQVRLTTLD